MKLKTLSSAIIFAGLFACSSQRPVSTVVPSIEYANKIKREHGIAPSAQHNNSYTRQANLAAGGSAAAALPAAYDSIHNRARYHFVSDVVEASDDPTSNSKPDVITNLGHENSNDQTASFEEHRSSLSADKRDYNGPLSLGDPGVSASLWNESRSGNDLFRDDRAWQPMDLITIVVSESAEGSKEADTEVKESSSISAAIEKFLGIEENITNLSNDADLSSLIKAEASNDFKGEGETTRKDTLKARISAMVAEVLPTGIIRIEGERIISVNNEEQVMVISGLVRPRDINSANEVDSSKIANMRIDYYGRGTVGEAQDAGWLGRFVRRVWPF